MPENWLVTLILPEGKRLSGAQERRFFEQVTPIPRADVLETLALIYHGVVPAFASRNLILLQESLAGIHSWGFKGKELRAQTDTVRRTYEQLLRISGCAAGLSSLGPLLFAIAEASNHAAFEELQRCCGDIPGVRILGHFQGRNNGHEVST